MYELKKEQFINIQSFMVADLGLTGNDLLVYAIIFGFSQDGENVFMGNRSYLAAWCNCSERSVQRNLNSLMNRGLIEQVCHTADNKKVYYRAICTSDNMSLVTNCEDTSDNMSQGLVTNCENTSDNMSPVYIDNINRIKQEKNKENIVVCDTTTPAKPTKKFQIPSIEEIKAFAESIGSAIDPEYFHNYYTANGWKIGKNPMKNWKAAFKMWESKEKKKQKSGSSQPAEVPYMQNDYSPEYLKKKEEDSLKALDDLLEDK